MSMNPQPQPSSPQPHVGQGATVQVGSDKHAATVVSVSPSGNKLLLRADRAHLTEASRKALSSNSGERQEYEFSRDPNGIEWNATLRKTGEYRVTGYGSTGRVTLGLRRHYRDPSV